MSDDAAVILAAVTKNVRTIVRNEFPMMYRPDAENITVTTQASCDTVGSADGFAVRVRAGMDAYDLLSSIYHDAAHYLCAAFDVNSHAKSGQHNKNFATAVATLGAEAEAGTGLGGFTIELPEKTSKATKQAVKEACAQLAKLASLRRTNAAANNRVTLTCPNGACSHSLTIRRTAAAKTIVQCAAHGHTMTENA